jgi:hypothetical protein
MRPPRLLAIMFLLFAALASFALAAVGCGGSMPADTGDMGDGGTVCTTQGTIALDAVCNTDCDCMTAGMICTKAPYDRKTMPVCTFTCDLTAGASNPQCPMGCNMKGYCKLQ